MQATSCIQELVACRDEADHLQQQLDQHRLAAAEASQHAARAQHALQEALEEQQSETRTAQTQASRAGGGAPGCLPLPFLASFCVPAGVGSSLQTQASARSMALTCRLECFGAHACQLSWLPQLEDV